MDWKQLGEDVRRARRKFPGGMTQGELAAIVHLSRNSIGHYERGERAPDFEDLRKIAAALRVDHFDVDDDLHIDFSPNGRPRPEAVLQQLNLDFDEKDGVTVRIQSAGHGVTISKTSA